VETVLYLALGQVQANVDVRTQLAVQIHLALPAAVFPDPAEMTVAKGNCR
jgi:hypothetical protein